MALRKNNKTKERLSSCGRLKMVRNYVIFFSWREMSVPSFLCMGNDVQGNYSFLGGRVDEDNEEGRSGDIELKS